MRPDAGNSPTGCVRTWLRLKWLKPNILREVAELLEAQGIDVAYAIHPVADACQGT